MQKDTVTSATSAQADIRRALAARGFTDQAFPANQLVGASSGDFERLELMQSQRWEWLAVVDENNSFVELVLRSDLLARCYTPLSVPEVSGNEWLYVKECLDTGWVSSAGQFVSRFERGVSEFLGSAYAVATSCGTAALHLALLVAGINTDDEVLMPTLTFTASANAVRYLNAWPVFMDVDPLHWQLDAAKLADFLKTRCIYRAGQLRNKTTGRRISAIMPVHLLGHPCPMREILELASHYGVCVVEDAAESLGSQYEGRMAGSIGDIAALSFNGNKIITTGGGGMVMTGNEAWASRARYLSTQARSHSIEYLHEEIGYNYRLTNLAAAVGVGQLECLPERIKQKRAIAERYQTGLARIDGLVWQKEASWASSNWWLFACLLDEAKLRLSSRQLIEALAEVAIEARPLFHPLHSQPPFARCEAFRMTEADRICRQGVCLPCSAGLSQEHQARVISEVNRLLAG